MNKQSFTEVFWIIGAMVISLITVVALIGNVSFEDTTIDFQLYDIYIEVEPWIILFSIFIFLLLITYMVKEGLKKFSDIVGNIILALILIGNIIVISYITNLLSFYHIFYSYLIPSTPLSALPPPPQITSIKSLILLIRLLLSFQFILAAGLLILGIKTGTLVHKPIPTPGWRS